MPTRDALCRESLEEQIRRHTATTTTSTDLLNVEGSENLINYDCKVNNNYHDNDNDIIATTMINKSINNITAESPESSGIVSATIESTDSYKLEDDSMKPTNSQNYDKIRLNHGNDTDRNFQLDIFISYRTDRLIDKLISS